jgi:CBS domain-containing protein
MYRFLEGTADQYMARAVTTVTRRKTLRELEAFFGKQRFQFFLGRRRRKDIGNRNQIRFSSDLYLHYRSDGAPLRRVETAAGRRNETEAVVHLETTASLTRVLQLMVGLRSRSFPVIGTNRQLAGMISREDVIRALKDATQVVREAR